MKLSPCPFFSIIIPTYNSAKTLDACLKSLEAQFCKDFEVVIIDGVSADHTMSIVDAYGVNSNNIIRVSEKDNGIYDAMNKGVQLAKGDCIYFLGSDDKIYKPDVLGKIKEAFTKDILIDVIYGNIVSTRFQGVYDGEFTKEKILHQNISHQAIFFKREILLKTGKFDLKYKSHADWDHNLRWFLSGNIKKKYIDLIIADYADGGFSSISGDTTFFKDINLKYLKYGHRVLSFSRKFLMWKNELKQALVKRQLGKVISVLLHSPFVVY